MVDLSPTLRWCRGDVEGRGKLMKLLSRVEDGPSGDVSDYWDERTEKD